MNAPEVIPAVVMLPVGQIVKSPTNPRKHFAEAALQELAGSIKEQGVLQPILVRKWDVDMKLPPKKVYGDMIDVHELVAGERRWRAATLAGLTEIPAIVRVLTDIQVLEIQVIENLQREDVHPLEEAEGYERLMAQAGYSAEALGDKIGKSRAYIYARLKLLDLCPEAREAFYDSKLDSSTALLVARIPGKTLQKKAIKELVQGYNGAPLSFRAAKDHVRRNFMLRLADATFKPADATLVPDAGSCKDCPKRTGNDRDLFGDVEDADVCTDPKCFDNKREAHYLRLKENAQKKGIAIIEGAEARKLMPYGNYSLTGGYVSLDATCREDTENRTYRQILGKEAPVTALIETNPTYDGAKKPLLEVADSKTLAEALKKAGIETTETKKSAEADKEKSKKAAEDLKVAIEKDWRARLFQAVRVKFGERFAATKLLAAEELTLLAVMLFERMGEWGEIETLTATWGKPVIEELDEQDQVDQFTRYITTLDAPALCLFLTDIALIGETAVNRWALLNQGERPEKLLAQAKRLDIDAEAIRKAVEAEHKATAKSKGKKPGELAPGLIYCHPSDPNQTWTGKGKPPAWAKSLMDAGGGLEVRELAEKSKPASTPVNAARAGDVSATAAPAKAEAETPKKAAPKKAKAKADPAPSSTANEAAAPPKTSGMHPMAAWPFPQGARP